MSKVLTRVRIANDTIWVEERGDGRPVRFTRARNLTGNLSLFFFLPFLFPGVSLRSPHSLPWAEARDEVNQVCRPANFPLNSQQALSIPSGLQL